MNQYKQKRDRQPQKKEKKKEKKKKKKKEVIVKILRPHSHRFTDAIIRALFVKRS